MKGIYRYRYRRFSLILQSIQYSKIKNEIYYNSRTFIVLLFFYSTRAIKVFFLGRVNIKGKIFILTIAFLGLSVYIVLHNRYNRTRIKFAIRNSETCIFHRITFLCKQKFPKTILIKINSHLHNFLTIIDVKDAQHRENPNYTKKI